MPRAKPKTAAARRASSRTTATPRPVSSESSLSPLKAEDGGLALDPDLLGQVDMLDGMDGGDGEENTDAALLEELEMGLGIIPSTDEPGDVDMEGTGEEAEDDAEEESDEDEEDAEEDAEEDEIGRAHV